MEDNSSNSRDNKAFDELLAEVKELNKNIEETNKSSERFSLVLVLVAVLQIALVIIQIMIPFFVTDDTKTRWIGVVIIFSIVGIIYFLGRYWEKHFFKKMK